MKKVWDGTCVIPRLVNTCVFFAKDVGNPSSSSANTGSIAIGVTVILGVCLVLCGIITIISIFIYKKASKKRKAYDASAVAFEPE